MPLQHSRFTGGPVPEPMSVHSTPNVPNEENGELPPCHSTTLTCHLQRQRKFTWFLIFLRIMFPSVCMQPAGIICHKGAIYLPGVGSRKFVSRIHQSGHCFSAGASGGCFHDSHVCEHPRGTGPKPESAECRHGAFSLRKIRVTQPSSTLHPFPK